MLRNRLGSWRRTHAACAALSVEPAEALFQHDHGVSQCVGPTIEALHVNESCARICLRLALGAKEAEGFLPLHDG